MNQRKNGAILSYINIIAKNLVNFFYTPFLLKFVGQADYGLFQMTNSVMISLSLLSMGFSSAYVRYYMVYKIKGTEQQIRRLNALYLIIFSFISLLALIIGLIIVLNTDNIYGNSLNKHELLLTKYLMFIMVLDVAITFISSVFDSNITVNEKFIFQQSRQLMQTLLVPIICVPLVFVGMGVLSVEITQITITIIFLLMNVSYCLKKLNMKFTFTRLPFNLLKELVIFSFFIFLNQIVDLVNNNAPNFILGITQGATLVATFAVAIQIKNMFFMLSTSLSSMFIPKVNELVNEESSSSVLTDLMIKVGRLQMTLLFFVLGGFIVVGKFFIEIWAGSQNISAYYLIILMVFPSIIPLSQNLGIEIQRAMNKHIFRSVVYFGFAMVDIIVTIIGSKYYGLVGASVGYVISIVCANGICMNWYYAKKMNLDISRYWNETLKVSVPFLIVVSMSLILQIFIKVNSFSKFIVVGVLYILLYSCIYWFIASNDYEKRLISSFVRR